MGGLSGLGGHPHAEPASTFGAEDAALWQLHDELAAGQALEARSAQEGIQLLVERAVQRLDAHSVRKTPVTLPRIWTCWA